MPNAYTFSGARHAYKRRPAYYNARIRSKAGQALKIAMATRALVNVEYKLHDVGVALTPSSSGLVSAISLLPQGDTTLTRDGNSVKMTSCQIRIRATQHSSAADTMVRVILFSDSQQQGVVPTVASVLAGADPDGFPNIIDFPSRFQIVKEWNIQLSNTGMASANRQSYFKMNHHLKFEGSGSTQAEQRKGNLYLLSISTEATNTPTVQLDARLRYIDN